jgi:hypothetical protein
MDARGKSLSLVDLHLPGGTSQLTGGDDLTSRHRSISMDFGQRTNTGTDAATGAMDLLDQGSPMGNESGDPSLLDEDSDSPTGSTDFIPTSSDRMIVDRAEQSTIDDPVYHQCRVARHATYQDKLVSVSVNDSFGSTVLNPSVAVGSLCDHPNIEKTFHGSRLFMGTHPSTNRSVFCSIRPI